MTREDCISRQAVLDSFWKLDIELRPCAIDTIVNMINNLPSVTQKTGKWINDWEMGMSECSCCGETYLWEDHKGTANFYFCPNCGAKMVELQESEG